MLGPMTCVFMRKEDQDTDSQREDHEKTQREGGHQKAKIRLQNKTTFLKY